MKSILIIETPTTCTDCHCYDYIQGVCANTHKDCELRKQAKPSWCPLRQIPDKAAEDLAKGLDAMEKMQSVEVRTIRRTE